MKITSVLFASAAALAAVSGAQAADAIVAAEPEAIEYVRVCDAFGTGFFYIPGTETCLKVGGYVRFQTSFGRNVSKADSTVAHGSDWDAVSRGHITATANTETELGTLSSFIALQANADSLSKTDNQKFGIDEVYLALGGFKAGYFYSWWDNGIAGEVDSLANKSRFNSVSYTYDAGAFSAGLSVDELEGLTSVVDNGLGVAGTVGFTLGGVSVDVLGGYDFEESAGAVRTILGADVGPGKLGLAAVWASSSNAYFDASKWSVAASYAVKVTDKLTVTPGVQYYSDAGFKANVDQLDLNLTLDYAITAGLAAKASVTHIDHDVDGTSTEGFLRLQRSF